MGQITEVANRSEGSSIGRLETETSNLFRKSL